MTTAEKLNFEQAERRVMNSAMIRVVLLREKEGMQDALQGYLEFASGFKGHLRSELRRNP